MSAEVQKAADAAHWGHLIEAVANQRAGFARLFDNFAPRVKTFMRRSSFGEAIAEELAQEARSRSTNRRCLMRDCQRRRQKRASARRLRSFQRSRCARSGCRLRREGTRGHVDGIRGRRSAP
jgi:hypothetical protein